MFNGFGEFIYLKINGCFLKSAPPQKINEMICACTSDVHTSLGVCASSGHDCSWEKSFVHGFKARMNRTSSFAA